MKDVLVKDPEALKFAKNIDAGAYVELKWISDEGHGFYEGNNRAIKMAVNFFLSRFKKKG